MPTYLDRYGVTITYYEWLVENPHAIVQLLHGVGEHAKRYEHVARALNGAGFSVVADDHRGHGATGMAQHGGDVRKLGQLGRGGHNAAVAAIHQLSNQLREQYPGKPLVLMGHSWGSLMAQILLNRHPDFYDACVLSGTAFRTLRHMNSGNLNKRFDRPGANGYEWLSRDEEVQRAFAADPLTTDAKVLKLFGLADSLRLFGKPKRGIPRQLPILIQIGEDDPLGGPVSVRRLATAYLRRCGVTDITLLTYPGARHEIYNEINHDEILDDLVNWLRARFPVRAPLVD